MKVRYFSDLHLEFIKPNKIKQFIQKIPSGMNEICILAGDIGNPYQENYDIFMKFISENFKKTFYIAGNHEYYNKTKTILETNEFMQNYFQQFHNISFLNNNFEIYENYCFIGTTLWSKVTNPNYEINDIYSIPNFDYIEYNKLNKLSIAFLQDTLQKNENCIVITHHVPSSSLIDIKYKTLQMIPYNQWFYCDMDDLIETQKDKIKYWIYGHTHTPSNVKINEISFLCNPIGYPNENHILDFQKSFTTSISLYNIPANIKNGTP
jgi:predicted phosphohydrolase